LVGWRRRRIAQAWAEFERSALDARSVADVERRLGRALADALDAELVGVALAESLPCFDAPVLRDLIDLDAPEAARQIEALDRFEADALVPLLHDGAPIVVAAARGGTLRPADDALAEDLALLGSRAARAWINARLYQEVADRSAGLEAEVHLRTAELEDALVELTATQAKLAEAERSSSLGLLVAGVSHEINNALNFISANLPTLARYAAAYNALLGAAPPPADAERVAAARVAVPLTIAELQEATRRTVAIVEDLRKFARPDAERRLIRVEEGLEAALNLLRRRTDGRLDVARLYVGSTSVEGYPGPLNQCFFNVLINAVEAARSEMWVVARSLPTGGVEVLISDDGQGVRPEQLELIFQPFFTTKPKAAGLGLTVSRGIVERHGGSIRVVSVPGQGATVRVALPASAPEAA
jgi:signal transduction histidine kinase